MENSSLLWITRWTDHVEADLALRTALDGDRYLLCSDGLSAVLDRAALHAALSVAADPEQVVQRLIELAYAVGAPDNIACVIADIVAVWTGPGHAQVSSDGRTWARLPRPR